MHWKTDYYVRRIHRFLGVFIGIQFLAWTLGGLFFAWSDMDEVHGDYEKRAPARIPTNAEFAPIQPLLDSLRGAVGADSIASLRLISILDKPYWQIGFQDRNIEDEPLDRYILADVKSGLIRPSLSIEEALAIARHGYKGTAAVKSTVEISAVNAHHEYRSDPVPAVAVSFDDPRQTTVYVATELGVITKFRNQPWRYFDWLWMLHTMDYKGRDNISNWVLKAFSILGLVTILSGFTLFFVSRKRGL